MDFAEKEGLLRAYRTSLCHSLVLTKTKTDGKIVTGCAINLPKGNGKLLMYIKKKLNTTPTGPKIRWTQHQSTVTTKKKIKELVGEGGNFTSETVWSTIVQPTQTNISITVIFRVKPFKHGYSRSILEIGQRGANGPLSVILGGLSGQLKKRVLGLLQNPVCLSGEIMTQTRKRKAMEAVRGYKS